VIVRAARTPIGRAGKGSLTQIRPDDLAAGVISAALGKVEALDPRSLDDIYVGCAEPRDEQGGNMARRIAVQLGFDNVSAATINRFCASSVQTARMAFHAIRSGEGHAFVSAGVECVSRYRGFGSAGVDPVGTHNPIFAVAEQRSLDTALSNRTWHDPRDDGPAARHLHCDGPDSRKRRHPARHLSCRAGRVRRTARKTLPKRPLRTESSTPNRTCHPSGRQRRERRRRSSSRHNHGGRVSAQASFPTQRHGYRRQLLSTQRWRCRRSDHERSACGSAWSSTPLARIVATGVSALSPEIMGLGPVEASRRALANAGMTINDVDLVELNEAFAVQVIASARDLGLDMERLNVHGGAIALGHPFGCTGARIMTTLLNAMRVRDVQFGLETMCVGGGQGMAIILERV
jgi:acetyl-CoA C-acetyltransferase